MGRPLRLAYLADPSSVHVHRWLRFFAERGHELHLLISETDAIGSGVPEGVAIHRFGRLGRGRVPIWPTVRVRARLRRILREVSPDVLHAHSLARQGWLARLSGFHPFVLTLWGSDVLLAPHRSRRGARQSRSTIRSADLITVAADHLAEAAVVLGAPPDRLSGIRFGVDTDRFRPTDPDLALRRQLGVDDRPLILSARALRPIYRHETVLDAVAGMESDAVVVTGARGADDRYLQDLRRRADHLGLGDRFLVSPEFSDAQMPALFASADLVVSVPESDGLPQTVLEAMAVGTPVVATDLPGARSCLATHPELLVRVGDAAALTQAMTRQLALGATEREGLARDLRSVVVERFEYRTHMLAMEEAYYRLAGVPPA
jgi:glycosyltransferase involved in cell wall biosynthesis